DREVAQQAGAVAVEPGAGPGVGPEPARGCVAGRDRRGGHLTGTGSGRGVVIRRATVNAIAAARTAICKRLIARNSSTRTGDRQFTCGWACASVGEVAALVVPYRRRGVVV